MMPAAGRQFAAGASLNSGSLRRVESCVTAGRVRKMLLISGAVLLLIASVVALVWWWPEPPPLRVLEVKEGDKTLAASRGQRMVSVTIRNRLSQRVVFDAAEKGVSYSYSAASGPGTTEVLHSLHLPILEGRASAGSLYQISIMLPNEAETVRFQMRYRTEGVPRRPFGIGAPMARVQPPSKASAWLQKAVSSVSKPLYDKLWPSTLVVGPLPAGLNGLPASSSYFLYSSSLVSRPPYDWKNTSLEVSLPKFARDNAGTGNSAR